MAHSLRLGHLPSYQKCVAACPQASSSFKPSVRQAAPAPGGAAARAICGRLAPCSREATFSPGQSSCSTKHSQSWLPTRQQAGSPTRPQAAADVADRSPSSSADETASTSPYLPHTLVHDPRVLPGHEASTSAIPPKPGPPRQPWQLASKQPGQSVPQQPDRSVPEQPDHSAPIQPDQSVPYQPGQFTPEQPGHFAPKEPGHLAFNSRHKAEQGPVEAESNAACSEEHMASGQAGMTGLQSHSMWATSSVSKEQSIQGAETSGLGLHSQPHPQGAQTSGLGPHSQSHPEGAKASGLGLHSQPHPEGAETSGSELHQKPHPQEAEVSGWGLHSQPHPQGEVNSGLGPHSQPHPQGAEVSGSGLDQKPHPQEAETHQRQPHPEPHFMLHAISKASLLLQKSRPLIEATLLLGLWYVANIYYNIYNKQVLQAFPFPMACTAVHILVAVMMLAAPCLLKLKMMPRITAGTCQAVVPLAIFHLLGFLTTNMSLGAVNVSLTHTIKSLEPFFTVLLSALVYGTIPAMSVLLTLIPIVAGVVVASSTDLSFNWFGCTMAMASNLALQSRNVLSKRYMTESSAASMDGSMDPEEVLNEVDLFCAISIASLPMALLVAWLQEGPIILACMTGSNTGTAAVLTGGGLECSSGLVTWDVIMKTILAGVCRCADVFASYGLLSRLNPVTHSVANCVKRVVVIAVSILFFNTQSSLLNIVGTVIALTGVFAYSMAERSPENQRRMAAKPDGPPLLDQIMKSLRGAWKRLPLVRFVLMQLALAKRVA